MRILLKGKTREVLPDLNPSMNFSEFQSLVASKTGLSPSEQCLLAGFPAKEVVAPPIAEISSVLNNGDTVLVKKSEYDHSQAIESKFPLIPNTGAMVRQEVARDSSCLFNSILSVCEEGKKTVENLRALLARVVSSDTQTYDSAVLGCQNEEYQTKIMESKFLGGSFELSVLSTIYKCEIVVFDFHFLREYFYGGEERYNARVFLLHSGNHYDPMVFELSESEVIAKFSPQDANAWERARKYARSLHKEAARAGECTEVKTWHHEKHFLELSSQLSSPKKPFPLSPPPCAPSATNRSVSPLPRASSISSKYVDDEKEEKEAKDFAPLNSSEWLCACTLRNSGGATLCEACGSPRDRIVEPWQCPSCTFNNDAAKVRCEMCQTPSPFFAEDDIEAPPQQTAPETLIEPFNPFVHANGPPRSYGTTGQPMPINPFARGCRWICPRCQADNHPGLIMCKQCKGPNMLRMEQAGCAIS